MAHLCGGAPVPFPAGLDPALGGLVHPPQRERGLAPQSRRLARRLFPVQRGNAVSRGDVEVGGRVRRCVAVVDPRAGVPGVHSLARRPRLACGMGNGRRLSCEVTA